MQSPLMYAGGMISSTVNQMGRPSQDSQVNQYGQASRVAPKIRPSYHSQPIFKDESLLASRH